MRPVWPQFGFGCPVGSGRSGPKLWGHPATMQRIIFPSKSVFKAAVTHVTAHCFEGCLHLVSFGLLCLGLRPAGGSVFSVLLGSWAASAWSPVLRGACSAPPSSQAGEVTSTGQRQILTKQGALWRG